MNAQEVRELVSRVERLNNKAVLTHAEERWIDDAIARVDEYERRQLAFLKAMSAGDLTSVRAMARGDVTRVSKVFMC